MSRAPEECKKIDMHLDLQTLILMAITSGTGWLMIESGVFRNLLERRGQNRVCPSCGRNADTCACD
jgi:hypothetical protein